MEPEQVGPGLLEMLQEKGRGRKGQPWTKEDGASSGHIYELLLHSTRVSGVPQPQGSVLCGTLQQGFTQLSPPSPLCISQPGSTSWSRVGSTAGPPLSCALELPGIGGSRDGSG